MDDSIPMIVIASVSLVGPSIFLVLSVIANLIEGRYLFSNKIHLVVTFAVLTCWAISIICLIFAPSDAAQISAEDIILELYNSVLSGPWGRSISALIIVGIAMILFGLRARYQFSYGLIELFIGYASIFVAIASARPNSIDLAHFVSIAGGVYIIIRGLDNMEKGAINKEHIAWKILRWRT